MKVLNALLVVSMFAVVVAAQVPGVVKDPNAVAVLNRMVTVTGWHPGSRPVDLAATGSVTRYANGAKIDELPMTVKMRGPSQFRMELRMADGRTTTTIVNGTRAALVRDGKTKLLPAHTALTLAPPLFGFYTDLIAGSDASVSVRSSGNASINAQAAQGVEVARKPDTSDMFAEPKALAFQTTAWVSSSSNLPVAIDFVRLATDNYKMKIHYRRVYSDYRTIIGVVVAFHQDEYAGSVLVSSTQLTSVHLNTGLSGDDFIVPAAAGGK